VLEFANKRNAKAIGRYLLGRSRVDPFDDHAPYEFVPLNWDYHPAYVERALAGAGLRIERRRAVSLFRQTQLKRAVSARLLARIDALIGPALGRLAPGPSQFLRCRKAGGDPPASRPAEPTLWRCPACGHEPLPDAPGPIRCPACGRSWPLADGIRYFRLEPDQPGG
jgi:hypothetical protein